MNFKPHGGFRKARLRTGSRLKNAVSVNWITFNSLAVIWFITVFPTLFFLAAADSPLDPLVRGVLYVLVLAITGLFAYLDVAKFDVAERKPRTFLKVEHFKTYFSRIFWLFIYLPSIVLVLMYYFLPLILSTANLNKLAPIFAPLLIVYLYVLFGATFYLLGMVGNVGRQPKVLKARSKAYFRVLSESLSNPSIEKRGKFSWIFEGIS